MNRIFNGSDENVNTLTSLFSDGKMITGKNNGGKSFEDGRNHTTNWYREEAIERAFYAAAIPAAWGANRPAPVVVEFGPNCKIDARKYFYVKPDQYNMGYRCINGHTYILAGVRDGPPTKCGFQSPGGSQCPSTGETVDAGRIKRHRGHRQHSGEMGQHHHRGPDRWVRPPPSPLFPLALDD